MKGGRSLRLPESDQELDLANFAGHHVAKPVDPAHLLAVIADMPRKKADPQ